MQQFTHFSRHAFQRLTLRTHLSFETAAGILDKRLFVDTGTEPGFNREHLLFYSAPDDSFFVAIRDSQTGSVITILPLDYHENLAWRVSDESCKIARRLFENAPIAKPSALPKQLAIWFVVKAHFLDDLEQYKSKTLLQTPSAPYKHEIRTILEDDSLFARLPAIADSKGINFARVVSVSVRLGHHGAPVMVNIA